MFSAPAPPLEPAAPTASAAHVLAANGALRALIVLALVALVVARGVAPALPGTSTGIAVWIAVTEHVAAVLSWALLAGLGMVTLRALGTALRDAELSVVFRLAAVPVGAGVLTLVISSGTTELDPGVSLALGAAAAIVALGAVPLGLASPATRAAGLVLAVAATASLVGVLARALAVRASLGALTSTFEVARAIATLAFVLDVLATFLAAAWLAGRRWVPAAIVMVLAQAFVGLSVWAAHRGAGHDATAFQVLVSRTLAELLRHPAPLVVPAVRESAEVFAWLVALCAAFAPVPAGRPMQAQAAVALAILARASTDIPLAGLMLLLAALLVALTAGAARSVPALRRGAVEAEPAVPLGPEQ